MYKLEFIKFYIDRCDEVIESGNIADAKKLQDEIIAIFESEITDIRNMLDNYSYGNTNRKVDYLGDINLIKQKIKYYLISVQDKSEVSQIGALKNVEKKHKVFISHSSQDKTHVACLVNLMEGIGLSEAQIFCSSIPGYGIGLGEDIYDYLMKQFQTYELHIFFILSENYYNSVACMNEMGASWVLQNRYTTILLPGFEFQEIKGAINPRQIGLKLDSDLTELKEKLGQLKETLIEEFKLANITDIRWERRRDDFITAICQTTKCSQIISDDALLLLQTACNATDGTILKITCLSGTQIQVANKEFITTQERREVAKWEGCLDELLSNGFIQVRGLKGEIFVTSKKGYDYIEQLKK